MPRRPAILALCINAAYLCGCAGFAPDVDKPADVIEIRRLINEDPRQMVALLRRLYPVVHRF